MRRLVALLTYVALFSCSEEAPPQPQPEPPAAARVGDAAPEAPTTDSYTGLLVAKGHDQVATYCQACHSLKLVAQNRADADGWDAILKWMSDKHNMAPIPKVNRDEIIGYLSTHYGPSTDDVSLRRAPLPPELMPPTAAALSIGTQR